MERGKLTGLVLAGGRSSRMGRDKALLKPWGVAGPTLVAHAWALLRSVCGSCVVSCQAGHVYDGLPNVEDSGATYSGPAFGILAGLSYAAAHGYAGIMALACDMPVMRAGLLRRLAARAAAEPEAWAVCFEPEEGGKVEMLAAVYRVDFLPALQAGIWRGEASLYRLTPAERRVNLKYGLPDARHFRNCNTPEDLDALAPRAHARTVMSA